MTTTNTTRGRRPGRPAGNSDTRERILASARELFARNGIGQTSIRAVATAAGVDSALVHHYFGTKEKLFAAAVRIPIDPMTGDTEWGMRSYQDDVDSTSWGGENVFDVYSLSGGTGLNGVPYSEW